MTRAWSSEFVPRERAWGPGWYARKTTRMEVAVPVVLAMNGAGTSKATIGLTVTPSISMPGAVRVARPIALAVTPAVGMVGLGRSKAAFPVTVNDSIGMVARHQVARTLPLVINDSIAMAGNNRFTNNFKIVLGEDVGEGSDFETTNPWAIPLPARAFVTTDRSYRGTKSLAMVSDGTATYARATLRGADGKPVWDVNGGDVIEVQFKALMTAGFDPTDAKIRFGDADNNSALVTQLTFMPVDFAAAEEWTPRTLRYTVPNNIKHLNITAVSNALNGAVYLDEIEILRRPGCVAMAGREQYAAAFQLLVNDSIGMAVTSRSGPAPFTIGPSPSSATDPDTDDAADWTGSTRSDPFQLVTDGPAALGPVMLKAVRATANSYVIGMPVRAANGYGVQDYDVRPGMRTTFTADVARVPGSPGGSVSIGIFVRHINSEGAIMATVIEGLVTASYVSSVRNDDNVVTITASAVAPPGAQRIDAGIYLTINTAPIGDGYYASNLRYVKDSGQPVIGMVGKPVGKSTVGLAVTPSVSMGGREAYARTLPIVVNDSISMVGTERYAATLPLVINDSIGMAVTSRSVAAFAVIANDSIGMAGRSQVNTTLPIVVNDSIGMAGAERYAATLPLAVFPGVIMSSGQLAYAAFAVTVNDSIGMAGRDQEAAAFGLTVNDSIGMAGLPRHGAAFGLTVTPAVAVTGRNQVNTTLPLVITDSIGMAGLPRHGAQFSVTVNDSIGMAGLPRHGAAFQVIANDVIGMTAAERYVAAFQAIVNDTIGMAGAARHGASFGIGVTPSVAMAADLRQVKFRGMTGFVDNNASTTSNSIGPFNAPPIPAGRGALVVCVSGYRTSSAGFNSLTVDYNGTSMTPVGPIVWGDNTQSSNSGFLRWFILTGLAADVARSLTVNWAGSTFMSPYFAIRAVSFSGVAGYTGLVQDGGIETGTALSQTLTATQLGSRLIQAFCHEPIVGDTIPSSYAVNPGSELGTGALRTTTVAGKGIMGHAAADGLGSHVFTAVRDSGADYLESGFELLPI